jgi:hypothetical protein
MRDLEIAGVWIGPPENLGKIVARRGVVPPEKVHEIAWRLSLVFKAA